MQNFKNKEDQVLDLVLNSICVEQLYWFYGENIHWNLSWIQDRRKLHLILFVNGLKCFMSYSDEIMWIKVKLFHFLRWGKEYKYFGLNQTNKEDTTSKYRANTQILDLAISVFKFGFKDKVLSRILWEVRSFFLSTKLIVLLFNKMEITHTSIMQETSLSPALPWVLTFQSRIGF